MKTYKSKKLLPSHKQGVYYLEHCRVHSRDDRLVYSKEEGAFTKFIAIPPKNTSVILLGSGTSITQAAARKLADEEVMVAFTGGYGTPLFLASQNEYRPTEWMQKWAYFWFDPGKRIRVARKLQKDRVQRVDKFWTKFGYPDPFEPGQRYVAELESCNSRNDILLREAEYAKKLYSLLAGHFNVEFVRDPGQEGVDLFNDFLDHGNYLAYGIAATALWVMGIPHSFPVLHGETRRGALVFDIADVIKDALVMPTAFQCAFEKTPGQDFRDRLIDVFRQQKSLADLIDLVQGLCNQFGEAE